MKKKKTLLFVCLTLLFALALSGCEGKALPEGMDEETLLSAGEEVTLQLVDGDYQSVFDRFRDDIQESLTVDAVKTLVESETEKAGNFKAIDDTLATGSEEGESHGIAVIYCDYSKKDVTFRVAFDPDMELIGLSVKKR